MSLILSRPRNVLLAFHIPCALIPIRRLLLPSVRSESSCFDRLLCDPLLRPGGAFYIPVALLSTLLLKQSWNMYHIDVKQLPMYNWVLLTQNTK